MEFKSDSYLRLWDTFPQGVTSGRCIPDVASRKQLFFRLKSAFRWYDGRDMFRLSNDELLDLAGNEASRLESQLKVQKNIAGVSRQ